MCQKLIDAIEKEKPYIPIDDYEVGYNNGLVMAQSIVMEMDVVEVVRCKDCKYWEQGKDYEPYCNHWGNMMADSQADDFCSYGERKDNERKAD